MLGAVSYESVPYLYHRSVGVGKAREDDGAESVLPPSPLEDTRRVPLALHSPFVTKVHLSREKARNFHMMRLTGAK